MLVLGMVGGCAHVDFVLLELGVEFVLRGGVGGEVVEGVAEDQTCVIGWLVYPTGSVVDVDSFTDDFS